jgi:hypothetical protein
METSNKFDTYNVSHRMIDAGVAEQLIWTRSEELRDQGENRLSGALAAAIGYIDKCPTIEVNGNTSDGYHTFNELYHHRAVLFSVICNNYPELSWKSKRHSDGSMYDDMFIVGIKTPHGQATYHYDVEPYWDMFHVRELERAPEWDGHTPQQAIERIQALGSSTENPELSYKDLYKMDEQPIYIVVDDINGFEPLTMWALVEVDHEEECVTLTNNLGGRSEYYPDSDFNGLHLYKHKLRRK